MHQLLCTGRIQPTAVAVRGEVMPHDAARSVQIDATGRRDDPLRPGSPGGIPDGVSESPDRGLREREHRQPRSVGQRDHRRRIRSTEAVHQNRDRRAFRRPGDRRVDVLRRYRPGSPHRSPVRRQPRRCRSLSAAYVRWWQPWRQRQDPPDCPYRPHRSPPQLPCGGGAELRYVDVQRTGRIRCQDSGSTRVSHHSKPIASRKRPPRQHSRGVDELLERLHPQYAGLLEQSVYRSVRRRDSG